MKNLLFIIALAFSSASIAISFPSPVVALHGGGDG